MIESFCGIECSKCEREKAFGVHCAGCVGITNHKDNGARIEQCKEWCKQ